MREERARSGESPCFLCGSREKLDFPYLNLTLMRWPRRLAYAIPNSVGAVLSGLFDRFDKAYRSVRTTNEYFSPRRKTWCITCSTGACDPPFNAAHLAQFYENFYWTNRDVADGQHIAGDSRPSEKQLWWAESRITWLEEALSACHSMIDFGAGDCAGAFAIARKYPRMTLNVVDPSYKAKCLAERYGFAWHPDLQATRPVDLIYSAHSIEHVHDLHQTLRELLDRLNPSGYLFFETPNIPSLDVFRNVLHTPHTFMLSRDSFDEIARQYSLRIVRTDFYGPEYRANFPATQSSAQTDLRVLLQRMD